MKELNGRVAVITGAASGIGRALAVRCAQEGMKVVLAGINKAGLSKVEAELRAGGATAISVTVDVARRGDVEALAKKTLDAFGAVHLLVNNAGVGAGWTTLDSTWEDWEWAIGVNLWGVIYGVKVFTPIMLAQGVDGHIVNTSSGAGFMSYHPSASYHVTKHAVVALSENLYHSLAARNSLVKVSVLCPGWVKTRIMDSERNRPARLRNAPVPPSPELEKILQSMLASQEAGMDPDEVAVKTLAAIRADRFYIFTHDGFASAVKDRTDDIVEGRNPRPL